MDGFSYREATTGDIEQMSNVRFSVKENILYNRSLVTTKDYEEYLNVRGKGWVCEIGNRIVGFAIIDCKLNSIWALFVDPAFERKGVGRKLQELMVDWYFQSSRQKLWLETSSGTRAEGFYKASGWKEVKRSQRQSSIPGPPSFTEIKYELSHENWLT